MTENEKVPVTELKRMLYELKALRPEVLVRFRLMGELWQTSFHRIVMLTEKGVALGDEQLRKLIFIDLDRIMQFELDQSFQKYQPYFHYSVEAPLVG